MVDLEISTFVLIAIQAVDTISHQSRESRVETPPAGVSHAAAALIFLVLQLKLLFYSRLRWLLLLGCLDQYQHCHAHYYY